MITLDSELGYALAKARVQVLEQRKKTLDRPVTEWLQASMAYRKACDALAD